MKTIIIFSFILGLAAVSCNDRASGNDADKKEEGPYQYRNDNESDSTGTK